jgi:hypothetical protein
VKMIVICIAVSITVSTVITKILATHYFKIVDGYVNCMIQATEEFVKSMRHRDQ